MGQPKERLILVAIESRTEPQSLSESIENTSPRESKEQNPKTSGRVVEESENSPKRTEIEEVNTKFSEEAKLQTSTENQSSPSDSGIEADEEDLMEEIYSVEEVQQFHREEEDNLVIPGVDWEKLQLQVKKMETGTPLKQRSPKKEK